MGATRPTAGAVRQRCRGRAPLIVLSGYACIKLVHVTCVLLSLGGFVVRGLWMSRDSPLLAARATRIAPHVVDTLLLASAVALAAGSGQYPLQQDWLTAKSVALLAYIGLGVLALRGPTRCSRVTAWLAALAVFAYIVSVALSRDPRGFAASW